MLNILLRNLLFYVLYHKCFSTLLNIFPQYHFSWPCDNLWLKQFCQYSTVGHVGCLYNFCIINCAAMTSLEIHFSYIQSYFLRNGVAESNYKSHLSLLVLIMILPSNKTVAHWNYSGSSELSWVGLRWLGLPTSTLISHCMWATQGRDVSRMRLSSTEAIPESLQVNNLSSWINECFIEGGSGPRIVSPTLTAPVLYQSAWFPSLWHHLLSSVISSLLLERWIMVSCLLAICISFFINCLFMIFAHFSIWVICQGEGWFNLFLKALYMLRILNLP